MLCVHALVRMLNDAKNYAQQGCAMQFSGITLMGAAVDITLILNREGRRLGKDRAVESR